MPGTDLPSPWAVVNNYAFRRTEGVTYVKVIDSDGDSSRWPGNDTKKPIVRTYDEDGKIDYYVPLERDVAENMEGRLEKKDHRWRKKLGGAFARHVLNHGKDPGDDDYVDPDKCILEEFPRGYKAFDHYKGDREDVYLFGCCRCTSFRSPEEFYPHLQWLARGRLADPGCDCPYCSTTSMETIGRRYFDKEPRPKKPSRVEESRQFQQARKAIAQDSQNLKVDKKFNEGRRPGPPTGAAQHPEDAAAPHPSNDTNSGDDELRYESSNKSSNHHSTLSPPPASRPRIAQRAKDAVLSLIRPLSPNYDSASPVAGPSSTHPTHAGFAPLDDSERIRHLADVRERPLILTPDPSSQHTGPTDRMGV